MASFLDVLKRVGLPWLSSIGSDNPGLAESTDLQGASFIMCGGSWFDPSGCCRSAFRNREEPVEADGLIGLRLSCSCPLDRPKMTNFSVVRGSGWFQATPARSAYRVFDYVTFAGDGIGLRLSCSSLPTQPMAANSPDLSNSPDNPSADSPDSSNLLSESFFRGASLSDICRLTQTPVGCFLSNHNIVALRRAFNWSDSPQGAHYWTKLAALRRPFTRSDKVILLDWIDQIEARVAQ